MAAPLLKALGPSHSVASLARGEGTRRVGAGEPICIVQAADVKLDGLLVTLAGLAEVEPPIVLALGPARLLRLLRMRQLVRLCDRHQLLRVGAGTARFVDRIKSDRQRQVHLHQLDTMQSSRVWRSMLRVFQVVVALEKCIASKQQSATRGRALAHLMIDQMPWQQRGRARWFRRHQHMGKERKHMHHQRPLAVTRYDRLSFLLRNATQAHGIEQGAFCKQVLLHQSGVREESFGILWRELSKCPA
eukprot:6192353-Pleurochrysis_carterae.AAC.2